jgi:hypothetical protein
MSRWLVQKANINVNEDEQLVYWAGERDREPVWLLVKIPEHLVVYFSRHFRRSGVQ